MSAYFLHMTLTYNSPTLRAERALFGEDEECRTSHRCSYFMCRCTLNARYEIFHRSEEMSSMWTQLTKCQWREPLKEAWRSGPPPEVEFSWPTGDRCMLLFCAKTGSRLMWFDRLTWLKLSALSAAVPAAVAVRLSSCWKPDSENLQYQNN